MWWVFSYLLIIFSSYNLYLYKSNYSQNLLCVRLQKNHHHKRPAGDLISHPLCLSRWEYSHYHWPKSGLMWHEKCDNNKKTSDTLKDWCNSGLDISFSILSFLSCRFAFSAVCISLIDSITTLLLGNLVAESLLVWCMGYILEMLVVLLDKRNSTG